MRPDRTTTTSGAAAYAAAESRQLDEPVEASDYLPAPRPHVHLPTGPGELAEIPLCGDVLTDNETTATGYGVRRWGWAITEGRYCVACKAAGDFVLRVSR